MQIGRLGHDHAEPVDRHAGRLVRFCQLPAQRLIGNHHAASHATSQIEGLGRRDQRDKAVSCLRHRKRSDNMAVTGHDQIVMHLVTDQHEIMFDAEIGKPAKLGRGPDAAPRIVGRAEQNKPFIASQLRLQRRKVHVVDTLPLHQLGFDKPPVIGANNVAEPVVDRGEHDDALTRVGKGADTQRQRIYKAMRLQQPGRIDAPVMSPFHPARKRCRIARRIVVIAIDAMRHFRCKGGINLLWRTEIHIGHPHRNAGVG